MRGEKIPPFLYAVLKRAVAKSTFLGQCVIEIELDIAFGLGCKDFRSGKE